MRCKWKTPDLRFIIFCNFSNDGFILKVYFHAEDLELFSDFPYFLPTVWMKSLTNFTGALILLHHYKRNLAHLLAF